jgi:hypothetical protein
MQDRFFFLLCIRKMGNYNFEVMSRTINYSDSKLKVKVRKESLENPVVSSGLQTP